MLSGQFLSGYGYTISLTVHAGESSAFDGLVNIHDDDKGIALLAELDIIKHPTKALAGNCCRPMLEHTTGRLFPNLRMIMRANACEHAGRHGAQHIDLTAVMPAHRELRFLDDSSASFTSDFC